MGSVNRKSFSKLNPKLQSFLCFIITFILFSIIFKTVIFIGFVPSPSMEPTLKTDSLCFGLRTINRDDIKVGDVVVFEYDGYFMVKRVGAIEGSVVKTAKNDKTTVPEGCLYMLGDNEDDSFDSRYWEEPFIKREDVTAKIIIPKT